jgi:nitrate reductase beta subunit
VHRTFSSANGLRTFLLAGRCHGGDHIMNSKSQIYQVEAEKCRHMAAQESCPDAREYYEALQRDYLKLASKAQQERDPALSPAR